MPTGSWELPPDGGPRRGGRHPGQMRAMGSKDAWAPARGRGARRSQGEAASAFLESGQTGIADQRLIPGWLYTPEPALVPRIGTQSPESEIVERQPLKRVFEASALKPSQSFVSA